MSLFSGFYICNLRISFLHLCLNMALMSRTIPVRYDDYWPSRYDRHVPIIRDPFPYDSRYSRFDDIVPFEFERRPLSSSQMWTSFDNEIARINNEMRRTFERNLESFWPKFDDLRFTDMSKSMADEISKMKESLALPSVDNWRLMENFRMDNPIIEDASGQRKFYLEYDMSQFKPEEIIVKTSGHQLSVQAKHEEKDENRSSRREYARSYLLPPEVNPEMLSSRLSDGGKLTIEANLLALPSASRSKAIPIEHKKY